MITITRGQYQTAIELLRIMAQPQHYEVRPTVFNHCIHCGHSTLIEPYHHDRCPILFVQVLLASLDKDGE